jgi:hypothetical protein
MQTAHASTLESASIQRQDHPIAATLLVDRVARHLLGEVPLVDDDFGTKPSCRGLDGSDLIATFERTRDLLRHVKEGAIGRQCVEVEGAVELDDARLRPECELAVEDHEATRAPIGARRAMRHVGFDEHEGRIVG